MPELFGGAADLSESNLTDVKGAGDFSAVEAGRNLRFGVREHAMGGIANGIAYHGGFIPYVGTFLTFSDYMRGSVRIAALIELHVVYVWTHDSVGLGEDGPTHQPVEQVAALRAIPGLWVVRPGDANETAAAWALAIERRDGPVALALSRQKLPTLPGTAELAADGIRRGGYVLRAAIRRGGRAATRGRPDRDRLGAVAGRRGCRSPRRRMASARVVSLPCWERFEAQDTDLPRQGPAAVRGRPRVGDRGRRDASAGSAGSATMGRSSGSIASAPRRPADGHARARLLARARVAEVRRRGRRRWLAGPGAGAGSGH